MWLGMVKEGWNPIVWQITNYISGFEEIDMLSTRVEHLFQTYISVSHTFLYKLVSSIIDRHADPSDVKPSTMLWTGTIWRTSIEA